MNYRLTIAAMVFTQLMKGTNIYDVEQIAINRRISIELADALIAAAGEGWERIDIELKPAEPPIKPVEAIKSSWSLRECFEEMRFDKNHHLGLGDIRLTIGQQDEICDLVERFYRRPAPVPSVEEKTTQLDENGDALQLFVPQIKSDWSIRSCFEGLRQLSMSFANDDNVVLERKQQDEICDLVEKFYKPAPVPSVGELKDWIYNNVDGNIDSIEAAKRLHRWLTERNNPSQL